MSAKPTGLLPNKSRKPSCLRYASVRQACFTMFGKEPADEKAILVAGGRCETDDLQQVTFEITDMSIKFGG